MYHMSLYLVYSLKYGQKRKSRCVNSCLSLKRQPLQLIFVKTWEERSRKVAKRPGQVVDTTLNKKNKKSKKSVEIRGMIVQTTPPSVTASIRTLSQTSLGVSLFKHV